MLCSRLPGQVGAKGTRLGDKDESATTEEDITDGVFATGEKGGEFVGIIQEQCGKGESGEGFQEVATRGRARDPGRRIEPALEDGFPPPFEKWGHQCIRML